MRVIPVLDAADGAVVHAAGGDRARYLPVQSPLVDSCEPVAVAGALLKVSGATELYVADLDALTGKPRQSGVISALVSRLSAELWLDAGVTTEEDLDRVEPGTKTILGTETLDDPGVIALAAAHLGANNVILSLDYRDGVLLGDDGDWQHHLYEASFFSGIQRFIVLDLSGVGTQSGTGTHAVVEQMRKRFPAADLIAGGGVRDWADITRLESAGATGVLVATALHAGTITFPRPAS